MRCLVFIPFFISIQTLATDYHIGPNQDLENIADAPWSTLEPGDRVYIHWRETVYKEKWIINRQGTEDSRIEIIGVPNDDGLLPVVNGESAITPEGLNFWNEPRGIIKIGGSNTPEDGLLSFITIENLEVKSGRPAYQFTNDSGEIESYVNNCAAIYVEKASHLIIGNCTLHDCGNGQFIGAYDGQTEDILIEGNHIYDNGIVGSFYEHISYTAAIDITFQFNHYGPLREGADGLVVRYNWIESGNRQLDLVDAKDSEVLVNHPKYNTTHVYGNILIEPEGAGNSQIAHYGGDSGTLDDYRKGDLYFYNNTVISTRSGNTTLIRLSSNDEIAHLFNNVIYNEINGSNMAMISGSGTLNMNHNWLKPDWQDCFCTPDGIINDNGNSITGDNPMFVDFESQYFKPEIGSPLIDVGDDIPTDLLAEHNVQYEFFVGIGIEDLERNALTVFPNPAQNTLTVIGLQNPEYNYKVFCAFGQLVGKGILKENRQIDISKFDAGVYHIQLGETYSGRFVKL